jgi:hypothetical protein
MRNLMFGAVAALTLGATGLYLLPHGSGPAPMCCAPVSEAPETAVLLPSSPELPEPLLEPIVVEKPDTDDPDDLISFTPASDAIRMARGRFVSVNAVSRRPDEPVRRMPYADEPTLPRVVELAGESEESEVKNPPASGPEPPLVEPALLPPLDYHHHHHPGCPYTGHCPYPQR